MPSTTGSHPAPRYEIHCRCGASIDVASIDMVAGSVHCAACEDAISVAELTQIQMHSVQHKRALDAASEEPPAGCSIEEDVGSDSVGGRGVTIIASTRVRSQASGWLFVSLAGLAIVGVFFATVVTSLWAHATGSVPSIGPPLWSLWDQGYDESQTGSASGGGGGALPAQPPSLTHTLVMAAFVALFLLVLVYALWIGLLCLAGRVLVRLEGGRGMVRTGVGPIRWTQRFDASAVRYVRMIDANGNTEATHGLDQLNDHFGRISIETDRKNVSLAKIMNKAERRWLLGVLRALLEPPR